MRQSFTLPAAVLGMSLLCISCSKTSQNDMVLSQSPAPAAQVLTASVSAEGFYELPVSSQNVKIHKQASHFQVSDITPDAKSGVLKYYYSPAKGFIGSDEVTLKETRTYAAVSNGGCNNGGDGGSTETSVSYVKIRFTIK